MATRRSCTSVRCSPGRASGSSSTECWVPASHLAEVHWHIDPSWHTTRTGPQTVWARHDDGMTMWILSLRDECELFHGSGEEALGWCAPVYGLLVPTSTIRMRRARDRTVDFVTVIVEAQEEPTAGRDLLRVGNRGNHPLLARSGGDGVETRALRASVRTVRRRHGATVSIGTRCR